MSLSTRVLAALALGIVVGLAVSATSPDVARTVAAVIDPIGILFVDAIRMTVVPLVVSSLVVGIAHSGNGAVVARIGGRGVIVFVTLLIASGLAGAIVAPPVLAHVQLDPAAVAAVRESTRSTSQALVSKAGSIQGPAQWVESLVPANAMQATVGGAMLPLIVFSLIFGLALLRLSLELRNRVLAIFRGITEAMLVLVRWILVVAPIGVFALTVPLVARLGLAAVGALATYVVLVSLVAALFMFLVLYPAAAWGGGISLRTFARAALPAQAVAFSSRSSMAALPALIDSARARLGLSEEITGFFIPLATVVFRVGAALGLTTGAVFIARIYGTTITQTQLATVVATAIITSFGIPGIPGGSIIAMVPVLAAVGLPVEGIGILLGVDTVPDMFRTTANVTGQLAAATIVARRAATAMQPPAEPIVTS